MTRGRASCVHTPHHTISYHTPWITPHHTPCTTHHMTHNIKPHMMHHAPRAWQVCLLCNEPSWLVNTCTFFELSSKVKQHLGRTFDGLRALEYRNKAPPSQMQPLYLQQQQHLSQLIWRQLKPCVRHQQACLSSHKVLQQRMRETSRNTLSVMSTTKTQLNQP